MTTVTSNATSPATTGASFSLINFLATLFQVDLREQLDAETAGDKSDAAYTWGL